MTRPITPSCKHLTGTLAAILLMTLRVSAVHAQSHVYPRAGVSSNAYRTPPQRLSIRSAQPLLVQRTPGHSSHSVTSPAERPLIVDRRVMTIDHREPIENVGGPQNRQTVRSELQRLYEQDGLEMPHMRIRSYQQQRPAPLPPTATAGGRAAPPVVQQSRDDEPGLLAGLFGFGRSRSSSRSAAVRRPPSEPAPFRPPTYRQQPKPIQQQVRQQQMRNQRPAAPFPQEQTPVARQQQPARADRSENEMEMQSVPPRYNDTQVEGDVFFPADNAGDGPIASSETAGMTSISDDLAEFFPEDAAARPAVDEAADTTKAKMQQLLQDHTATAAEADGDAFQMPVIAGQEEVIPQPAPAAVSDLVTTTIDPTVTTSLPSEPAPFFADEERAINPQERMHVVAITGQTFDPSGTDTAAANRTAEGTSVSRMQQIAARDGVGLKGFCPVALRDERKLADGRAAYVSYHQGKPYYFSSQQAKARFDEQPTDYAPASSGEDVTMKTLTGEVVEGSLDHSVWYKNRLYLFHSAENLKTFMAAPAAMAVSR